MATRLALEQWSDWLEPGSPSDSRLLHSDKSDRIFVCPSHLGQGYIQEIVLGDDLSLVIENYRLDRDLIIDIPCHDSFVQFSLHRDVSQANRYKPLKTKPRLSSPIQYNSLRLLEKLPFAAGQKFTYDLRTFC